MDSIAAISTPFGEGAVALIRLSGPNAIPIAQSVFSRALADAPARTQQFGRILDGAKVVDEVLLTVFRAPGSFTGEDMVEISCHGGILVTRRILQLLLSRGARSAEPGEFSQRAFLNGKLDLTQAEAIMDLIKAQTTLALRAATEQLEGRLGKRIWVLRDQLLSVLAHVEAYIDFPEEDIDPETGATLLASLDAIRSEVCALLDTADQGRVLREGVRTVIAGEPNVGKSSLLNLLLGTERAIVSETPGTTRDTIEEVINLRGIPLRLVDTAGLRHSTDAIELEGMARTRKHLEQADLVLRVVDGSQPIPPISPLAPIAPTELLILNKTDRGLHPSWADAGAVRLSCLTGEGLEQLGDAIFQRILGGNVSTENISVAINARHQACLSHAKGGIEAARQALESGLSAELIAVELRLAMEAIGEVVGKADSEELLGKIFSTFCIGK